MSIAASPRASAARAGWRRRGRAAATETRACGRSDNSANAQSNSSRLPDNSARRIRPAVSWPVARRCCTRPRMSSPRERCRDIHGRAVARLARDPHRAISAQPVPGDDELRQRVRQFGDQRDAASRRADPPAPASIPGSRRDGRGARRCGPMRTARVRRRHFRSARVRPTALPTSAIAAQTEGGRLMRRAMAHCISQLPVAMMSTRSASIRSGECSRTGSATEWLVERQRLHDRRRALPSCAQTLRPSPGEPAAKRRRAASAARLRRRRDRPRTDLKSARPAPAIALPLRARLPERSVSN